MSELVTWRELITHEMFRNDDSWGELVGSVVAESPESRRWRDLPEPSLDRQFDPGYGGTKGDAFTVWTHNYVYFPVCYDGAESVGSVPRNPGGRANDHVGG